MYQWDENHANTRGQVHGMRVGEREKRRQTKRQGTNFELDRFFGPNSKYNLIRVRWASNPFMGIAKHNDNDQKLDLELQKRQ